MSQPPRAPADAAEAGPRGAGEPAEDAARRALAAAEARFARLVELLPDGVVTCDAAGRITSANAAAARLHGVGCAGDVVGQPARALVHPDSLPSARARLERLARGEPSPAGEERLVRADGTPYLAEVAAAPLGAGEVLVVVRDPTSRPAAAERTAPPAAPLARGGRVLLVEDDPPVARALGRILERLGYEVTVCGDGAEALARFRADPARFDAVLTDETLPGMRGHQLTRELLALRPDLPVLICTGYSEHLDEERARQIGARGLFMKPFDVAQLGEALRAALAR